MATGADEKRSPLSEPYVAMTYPWAANALPPRHEKLTLGGDWLPIDEVLPRAVQEAAMLTLAAGLTYLWVEYICAGGDDRQQCVAVGERGDILAASAFNIAACSAPTVDSPLLPDSSINPPQPAIPVLRLTHAGPSAIANEADSPTSGLFAINHDDLFLDSLDDGAMDALPPLHTLPVYHHALLLSPATLFVTKQQLFWRCAASRSPAFPRASGPLRCETYPFGCGSGSDPGATGVNGAALHHANERYGTSPKRFMDIEIFGADEGSDSGNGYAVFGERVAALWCEIVKVLAGTEGSVQDRAEVAKNVAHHLRILSSGTAAAPAKQEFDSPHVVYSSGLWLFPTLGEPSGSHRVLHVVEPLLWHVKSHALLSSQRLDAKATTLDGDDPKPPPQQQPSWSWLSARGTVAYVFHGAYGQCMPAIYPSFGGSTSPGGEVGAISMTRRAPAVAEVVDIRRAAATVDGTSAGGMDQLVLRGRILPVAIREVPSPLWRLPGEEPCPPVLAATVLGLPPPKEQTATSDCKTPHMAMNALRIMPDSPHEWSRLHEAAAATAAVEAEPAGQKQDEAAKEEFAALPLTGIKLSATPYQNESMAVQGLLLRKVNKDKHHIGKDGVLYRRCGLFMCDHVWPGETLNWEALRLDDEALKETVVVV